MIIMVKNKFYLDILDKILNIDDKTVMIAFDDDNNIWFAYSELLYALGYDDIKSAKKDLNINKKYFKKLSSIKNAYISKFHNLQLHTKMINNNGLYMLLSLSTKPLAKQFMQKYIDEIMPEISSRGVYISNDSDQEKNK